MEAFGYDRAAFVVVRFGSGISRFCWPFRKVIGAAIAKGKRTSRMNRTSMDLQARNWIRCEAQPPAMEIP